MYVSVTEIMESEKKLGILSVNKTAQVVAIDISRCEILLQAVTLKLM